MTTVRPRGGIVGSLRPMQRQSIGSHAEIEEPKPAYKEEPKKTEPKNRQTQIHVYKKRTEQSRSKSEMGFFPSPDGAGFATLKKCLERDTFWDKLVNKKLNRYFTQKQNLKAVSRPPKGPPLKMQSRPLQQSEVVCL